MPRAFPLLLQLVASPSSALDGTRSSFQKCPRIHASGVVSFHIAQHKTHTLRGPSQFGCLEHSLSQGFHPRLDGCALVVCVPRGAPFRVHFSMLCCGVRLPWYSMGVGCRGAVQRAPSMCNFGSFLERLLKPLRVGLGHLYSASVLRCSCNCLFFKLYFICNVYPICHMFPCVLPYCGSQPLGLCGHAMIRCTALERSCYWVDLVTVRPCSPHLPFVHHLSKIWLTALSSMGTVGRIGTVITLSIEPLPKAILLRFTLPILAKNACAAADQRWSSLPTVQPRWFPVLFPPSLLVGSIWCSCPGQNARSTLLSHMPFHLGRLLGM